jgi:hypothetical protein
MALALKHATRRTAGDEDDRTSLRRRIHLPLGIALQEHLSLP